MQVSSYLILPRITQDCIYTVQLCILYHFDGTCCVTIPPYITNGQKIARRLSISITKETGNARKLLSDYCAASSLVGSSIEVTLAEVLSPDSDFWKTPPPQTLSPHLSQDLSWDVKKDITQAYLLIKRSEEELDLLSEEKNNVLSYWVKQKVIINQEIHDVAEDSCTPHSTGSVALLKKRLLEVEQKHSSSLSLFSSLDDQAPSVTVEENWSPYEDSDLESSSDYDDD